MLVGKIYAVLVEDFTERSLQNAEQGRFAVDHNHTIMFGIFIDHQFLERFGENRAVAVVNYRLDRRGWFHRLYYLLCLPRLVVGGYAGENDETIGGNLLYNFKRCCVD